MLGEHTKTLTLVLLVSTLHMSYQAATPEKPGNQKPRVQAEALLQRRRRSTTSQPEESRKKLSAQLKAKDSDGGALTGQLLYYWAAPDKWRRDITVGKAGRRNGTLGAIPSL